MKDDIRKKFLDMLFEPVEEEPNKVVAEGKLTDLSPFAKKTEVKEEKKEVKKEIIKEKIASRKDKPAVSKTVSAKEYLYKKSVMDEKYPKDAKISSFIFLEDAKKKKKETEEKKKDKQTYTLTSNLSPMFGLLDADKEENETVPSSRNVKQNYNSVIGTVISPIYGTSVQNDYSNSMNLSIEKVEKYYEPFIEKEIPEPEPDPAVINDKMRDEDNLFINEDIDEEFEKAKSEEFDSLNDIFAAENKKDEVIDESVYRQVFNEERSFSNTAEIDLFEDLFKEDDE